MRRLYVEYYLIILGLGFGFTWFVYPQLPEVMITHWGLYGQANGWMHKSMGAWLMPIILIVLWLMWEILPSTYGSKLEERKFYQTFRLMGLWMLLFLGGLQIVVLGINMGWQIDMLRVTGWFLVVFTAILGQLLPEMPLNPIMGIRTPWSMKNSRVWRKTHQETGRWCRAVSLVDIILMLALPLPRAFLAVMVGFLGCIVGGVLFSYVYRRR